MGRVAANDKVSMQCDLKKEASHQIEMNLHEGKVAGGKHRRQKAQLARRANQFPHEEGNVSDAPFLFSHADELISCELVSNQHREQFRLGLKSIR